MPRKSSQRPAANAFASLRARPVAVMALAAGALLLVAVCGYPRVAAQTTSFVELASLNAAGTQAGNVASTRPRSSEDGRFVVFESNANNLVPNDTNNFVVDVFVRDLQLDTTQLVSVNAAGTGSGDGRSSEASITPDGRYVVFKSDADDLIADKVLNGQHVYVRDLVAQKTTLVSFDSSGALMANPAHEAAITPDGRYVIFRSSAEIYRRDLSAGTTVLVSTGAGVGVDSSSEARITPDGRFVVFRNATGSFFSGTLKINVFRRDLQTNTTALVSVNYAGTEGGNGVSLEAVVSDDGQLVAFTSAATNLLGPDNPLRPTTSVYVRNFADNTTTLVSEPQVFQGSAATIPPSLQPRISADGRYVFYLRIETVNNDGLNRPPFRDRVFRRDRQTGALLELPFVPTGICDQRSECLSLINEYVTSRDGRYVAYRQQERPRTDSTPYSYAIVVRDMVTGGAGVINGFTGVPNNITDQYPTILSPGSVVAGGKVAFSSGVSHSPADTNISEDVYLFAPAEQTRFAFNRAGYEVKEDGSRLSTHVIIVRRTGQAVDTPSTVKVTTSDGTATAGSDYVTLSETLNFAPGETEKAVAVQIVNDDVLEPAETLNLTLSDPTGNSALGGQSGATLTIGDDDLHTVQFGPAASFDHYAFEVTGSVLITVTRTGATTQPVSVDYTSSGGTANERSDYIAAAGRVTFAPGETTKTIRVFIVNDAYVESDETFSVTLSNLRGANAVLGAATTRQMFILSEDAVQTAANPVDDTQFFVRQHYLDFLGREPDPEGFQFWTGEIEGCGADLQCREVKRVNVSAAFFLSIEFQQTGYLVYRTYKAAYGDATSPNVEGTVPVLRLNEFLPDTQIIGDGAIVGQPGWEQRLAANKSAYMFEFVQRPRFLAEYPLSMGADEYLRKLAQNAGFTPTGSDYEEARALFRMGPEVLARAGILRLIAEKDVLRQAEFRRAFVLMQYFGYLRRNPNDTPDADFKGWKFWLDKLNKFDGNYVEAEMVKAFLNADEYRHRFGK